MFLRELSPVSFPATLFLWKAFIRTTLSKFGYFVHRYFWFQRSLETWGVLFFKSFLLVMIKRNILYSDPCSTTYTNSLKLFFKFWAVLSFCLCNCKRPFRLSFKSSGKATQQKNPDLLYIDVMQTSSSMSCISDIHQCHVNFVINVMYQWHTSMSCKLRHWNRLLPVRCPIE